MPFTAGQIAQHLNGSVLGDSNVLLSGFAPANAARPGDLTFAENSLYFEQAEKSAASAVLVGPEFRPRSKTLIQVPNPRVAFARVVPLFFPEPVMPAGIHPSAVIAPSARIDPSVHVGPFCIIEENVRIGAGSVLRGQNYVAANCDLGAAVSLFPRVTLYQNTVLGNRVTIHAGTVVGADGFGYVFDEGRHLKVPQNGGVIIEEDVEIGANVTIDRGALGATVIGRGTKIDNLVQVAHNVVIGSHCLVVAQTGIAGSTRLGNYVTLAGQAGLAGHLKIGDKVTVAAQSGVMHNISEGEKWFGTPAQPDRQMKRQLVALQQLPELLRRVAELEKRFNQIDLVGSGEK